MKLPVINNWSTTATSGDNPYLAPENNPLVVQGHVHGRDGFEDGSQIVTSHVVDVRSDRWGHTIDTVSGSRYRLGTVDAKWVAWLRERGIEFDPRRPIIKRNRNRN